MGNDSEQIKIGDLVYSGRSNYWEMLGMIVDVFEHLYIVEWYDFGLPIMTATYSKTSILEYKENYKSYRQKIK